MLGQPGVTLGIRGWLLALALAVALPVLVFAGVAAERLAVAERRATLTSLEYRTEAAAHKIERYLQSVRELAVTLATSPTVLAGDLPAFYDFATRALEAGKFGRNIQLVDPQGQQLLNTRLPFDAALRKTGDLDGVAEAVAARSPRLSNLYKGSQTSARVLSIWVPVLRDGKVTMLVGVAVDPRELTKALQEEHLPDGWIGAVIDRNGNIVARTHDAATYIGRQASPDLRASIAKGLHGVFPGVTADGIAASISYQTLADTGWNLAIGVPKRVLEAPTKNTLQLMLGLGLAALSTASLLSFLVGRHMSGKVASVARAAIAVGEGRAPAFRPSSVRELDDVSGALAVARGLIDTRETALRESQAALHTSEERLRLAIEAAGMGLWDWDLRGDVLLWTPHHESLFGYAPGTPRRAYADFKSRLHPDDVACAEAAVSRAIEQRTDYQSEYRVVWPDGSIHWITGSGRILRDQDDRPIRMLGMIVDNTTRKRRERNLAFLGEMQNAFAPLADATAIMRVAAQRIAAHLDLAHCALVEVNESAEACTVLHDHNAVETVNLVGDYRLGDFLSDDERRILETGGTLVVANVRDGQRPPERVERFAALRMGALINASYLADRHWKFFLHVSRVEPFAWPPEDVELLTELAARIYVRIERARAETALADSLRVNAVACEAGHMGTWHRDIVRNRLTFSDELLALIGIERDQWSGTPEALEPYIHPDDIERRRRERALAEASGKAIDIDFRIRRPDGQLRWLQSRGRIARATDGTATESFGVMMDVTDRKLLIAELDHRVKNVLAQVGVVAQRTRQGSASLDAFMTAFDGRIDALSNAHLLLSRNRWAGASLAALVREELKPYETADNVSITGTDVTLTADAAQCVATVLHELATNAGKYGALSAATGRVSLRWQTLRQPAPAFEIVWQENGGPPVVAPSARGYGTSVIRDQIPFELEGDVDLTYPPDGVRCRMEFPLKHLTKAEAQSA